MKFIVHSEEHSTAIQEQLFKLGYSWFTVGKKVSHTYKEYLFTEGKLISCGHYDYYEDSEHYDFVSLDDLFEMTSNAKLMVNSLDYYIEITDNGVKVGCQTITKEDAKRIAEFFNKNIK